MDSWHISMHLIENQNSFPGRACHHVLGTQHHKKDFILLSLTLAEGELLIIAVRTPKAWIVILSTPFSQTYDTKHVL